VAVRAALALFLGLIVWAPWPLGSNRPWAWTILELGIFLSAALWIAGWMRGEVRHYGVLKFAWPALAIFAAWIAYLSLHWIPLPAAWVQFLSPESAAVHRLAAQYAPDGGARMTISVEPHSSLAFWLKSCAYALAFALTLAFATTRDRARLIAYTVVLSGLLQAVYGSLMHLSGGDLEIFGTVVPHSGNATGGFVNRNHLAGCLEISLAMGIGLLIGGLRETGQRSWRQFWRDTAVLLLSSKAPLRLFLVAMVIALVMTHSRMGNSGFFSSLLIAGGAALLLRRYATRGTMILVTSLVIIDIFIVGTWFGVEKTIQRIEQTTAREVEERVEPSEYALEMLHEFPVLGAGAGTFYTAFSRYRSPDIRPFYDFAHNDFTQFVVETGVLGALLVGSLPILALGCGVLALSRRRDPLARGFGFAVIMGVSSIAMHSTVDFNLQIPANAFAFVVLLAFGWIALYLDRRKVHSAVRPP
jgi:hypothetical protein